MRNLLIIAIAAVALGVATQPGQEAPKEAVAAPAEIVQPVTPEPTLASPWRNNYETAAREAKASGKTLFVFLTRGIPPCAPCITFERNVLRDPRVVQQLEGFVCIRSAYNRPSWIPATPHRTNTTPVVVFVKPDGTVTRYQAPQNVETFVALLRLAK